MVFFKPLLMFIFLSKHNVKSSTKVWFFFCQFGISRDDASQVGIALPEQSLVFAALLDVEGGWYI